MAIFDYLSLTQLEKLENDKGLLQQTRNQCTNEIKLRTDLNNDRNGRHN